MNINKEIDLNNLPKHVAIIMDGNGRWAKKVGKIRIFGHQNAIKAVRDTIESAAEIGIKYLTLYTFSTENWNRPKAEVNALMELLVNALNKETPNLMENNIKLVTIGQTNLLPKKAFNKLQETIDSTKNNTGLTLVLALSYSSKWELTNAIKNIANDVKESKISIDSINDELISSYLETRNIPDPELMIRTSGEIRISNFLLWQIAYSELYFTDVLWPDFGKEDFTNAILEYQKRERRFGKTTEQLVNK